MTFTLQDIRSVFRNVTGNFKATTYPDSQVDDLINKFYIYVLPDENKMMNLKVDWRMWTRENQVTYPFDQQSYISVEPEFFINGNRLLYYQNQSLWIRDFQYQYNQQSMFSGDGVTAVFSGTFSSYPIVPGSVIVTDGNTVFSDPNGQTIYTSNPATGTLNASQPASVGTVNYTDGTFSVTFGTIPVAGAQIIVTSAPINPGAPRAMYFDGDGHIQFSPIPDQSYLIEGTAYQRPTVLLSNANNIPIIQQWGYTIAYGASLEAFRQKGQFDQIAMYKPEYEKYLDLSLSATTQQWSNQRTVSKW